MPTVRFPSLRSAGLAVVLAASSAVAVNPVLPTATAEPTTLPLSWGACPERVASTGAVCATLSVPRDYAQPEGERLELTVSKLPARNPQQRRGMVFGNAGGPGGDSLTFFDDSALHTWPAALRDEWDLIGVQPRGLPDGAPLRCAPLNPTDIVQMATNSGGALRAACEAGSPGLGQSLTTENTARDWEEARRALGAERISILGLSYGTLLGSTYATLFPQRVDRLVLDSPVDPNRMWNEVLATQTAPYKARVYAMFEWIAQNDAVYGLGDTPLKVYQSWSDRIVKDSGTNPTLAPPPAQVGDVPPAFVAVAQQWAELATVTGPLRVQFEGLLSQLLRPGSVQLSSPILSMARQVAPQSGLWPRFAEALQDQTPLPQAAPDGADVPEAAMIAQNMQSIMLCNENQVPARPWDYPAALWTSFVTGDIFDFIGLSYSSGMMCQGAPPVTTPIALSGKELAVAPLAINSLADPQTPFDGAQVLAQKMGAPLIRVEGGDHGQVAKGNAVVDNAVIEYLRTGRTALSTAPAPPSPVAE